ncbi:hypothetical protein ACHAXT_004392 [Thalassiosira profunda]
MSLPQSVAGLVHAASLTNQELFTAVAAAIKQSFGRSKGGGGAKEWRSIALQIASSAARGVDGYSCKEDWVRQFKALSSAVVDAAAPGPSNFGEALRQLPETECYRKRLDNALDALAATSNKDARRMSVRQAAGLIRGSALLASREHQTRAISQLVRCMPQLATTNPRDVFLAVQLPLLQKIDWNAFLEGGVKFASPDEESDFQQLINLDTCDFRAGEKRKRASEEHSTLTHLLEAADLARKGAVRAQHGAVIYTTRDGEGAAETKVIGRGWNHNYVLKREKFGKNKIVLHSEVMAVADAIRNHGEDKCFDELFPQSTILIVELEGDYAYDTCHPCPKCDPMLRAVGIPTVLHTTPGGALEELKLGPGKPHLLSRENVCFPLGAACDELGVHCSRLPTICNGKVSGEKRKAVD